MRAILARLRGTRVEGGPIPPLFDSTRQPLVAGGEFQPAPAASLEEFIPGPFPPIATNRELGYTDAVAEALKVCEGLGIKVLAPLGAGDLTRFVYSQGWLACEGRRWRINPASTDMADLIHQALNSPGTITEKVVGESTNHHLVRAVQQVVTYGVKSEPH